ncbi:YbaB/EbfC family nucleoid-associated protein [Coxiella endosymbiont of Ornithodoros amblus]|uniref:YbaB/EbfC family nucleoid-associated protein n=1 Tax=Coxiella endosymbiont of Ornithodoros amblus TaxID=1656166 RepID=UPI00244DAF2A|nr:YbaB/EbfC family nucleoid-associated protein [Coxiella endosymbiont of Ornithodoros amblus]MBW5802288.1 YbaB/EbfC family nucleoid-associated protein [Coxiella endosymbiont of Ornithodoros amblus]
MSAILPTEADRRLLPDVKESITDMQQQMQATYSNLADLKLLGEPHDKTVRITMIATYNFEDIEFDERALQGGVKEFKWRIREAWKNLCEIIQKTTQSKTIELLRSMRIPEDIRNLSVEEGEEWGQGTRGVIGNPIARTVKG